MSGVPAFCPRLAETRRLVGERLADTISLAASRELKAHLSTCAPCRVEALRLDPTLLFSPLAGERPSHTEGSEARGLSADILSAIELERARRRIAWPARGAFVRAASVAILAGGVMTLLHVARRPRQAAPARAADVSVAQAPHPSPPRAPVLIDHLGNPGVTVYHFASTSALEPNVVFVVDRNADI